MRNLLFWEDLMTGAKASAPDAAQPENGESQELDLAQLQQALAEAQQLASERLATLQSALIAERRTITFSRSLSPTSMSCM